MKKLLLVLFFLNFNFLPFANANANANTNTEAKDFDAWKSEIKPELLALGASENFSKEFIESLDYLPRVIELDKKQPEGIMTHEQYLAKVIPESKIKKAREVYKSHKTLLNKAEKLTGVPSNFIVALWGKETHFGSYTGNYHVPSALATLAFEGRRAAFFRKELMAAVQILLQGHTSIEDMKGSWAGAMGNCQFMPTSFLSFAVDANGDGKKNIWSDKEDIFASMGNYLAKSGWQAEQTWGRQVKLIHPFESYPIGKEFKQPLSAWQKLGVRRSDLRDLPNAELTAYLIAPGGKNGRLYLVYENFDVLMRWNRSHYFATGVGYLADRISYPMIE